jgi:hypothetical protein
MPALMPIMLTVSHVVLASNRMPELKFEPGCRAAVVAAVTPNRDANACERDELAARDKLKKDWASYTSGQQTRCVSLSKLGGFPSYVELLTCLETAKEVDQPDAAQTTGTGKK